MRVGAEPLQHLYVIRKGAVRIREIPTVVRELLDAGVIESVNLVEWLAVDQTAVLQKVLPKLGLRTAVKPALACVAAMPKPSQLRALAVTTAICKGVVNRYPWPIDMLTVSPSNHLSPRAFSFHLGLGRWPPDSPGKSNPVGLPKLIKAQ